MGITTKDIARICGISLGSVNRALHNKPGVSTATKEKILRVSRELGYRPHLLARSLATGKSMTVGLIMATLKHPAHVQMATSFMEQARSRGYFVHLSVTNNDKKTELADIERLASLNVDGFILVATNKGRDFGQYLTSLEKPIVTTGNVISGKWPFVGIDEKQATYEAVQFIASRGYSRIVYVNPSLSKRKIYNMYSFEQRLLGFKQGARDLLDQNNYKVLLKDEYLDQLNILDYGKERTAIMCAGDFYALEVLAHLRSQGVKVPADVGLMGFGNIDFLRFVKPSIATVDFHAGEIASKAMNCLLNKISGEKVPLHTIIPHRIIPGETL